MRWESGCGSLWEVYVRQDPGHDLGRGLPIVDSFNLWIWWCVFLSNWYTGALEECFVQTFETVENGTTGHLG